MGIKHAIFPLWKTHSRDDSDTEKFLAAFYKAIKAGKDIVSAQKAANLQLSPEGQKKPDRSAPARLVLF
jgi:hypothetical protein